MRGANLAGLRPLPRLPLFECTRKLAQPVDAAEDHDNINLIKYVALRVAGVRGGGETAEAAFRLLPIGVFAATSGPGTPPLLALSPPCMRVGIYCGVSLRADGM